MFRKLKDKKGNEILQTLVIIAVIGALAITVCVLISNKIKATSKENLNTVGNGLSEAIDKFSPQDSDWSFGESSK